MQPFHHEVPELLNRKFFTKAFSFQGLLRIEKGEYPVAAEGLLPQGLSLESLKRQHPSRPRNPLIADVCFNGGYIVMPGDGVLLKIIDSCREAGLPEPEIIEQEGVILVTLFKDRYTKAGLRKMSLNERQVKAVKYVTENGKITNKQYQ